MAVRAGRLMPATSIDLPFADGVYTFRLGLAQINEIQAKCNIGIGGLFARVIRGRYSLEGSDFGHPAEGEFYLADIVETIRQGLIGGGRAVIDGEEVRISPHRANELIAAYVLASPLKPAWDVATAVLTALIEGYEPQKKAEPPKAATETTDGSIMPAPSSTSV